MTRVIQILSSLVISLCILNAIALLVIHFYSPDVVTPFPIRASISIMVGGSMFLLLRKRLRVVAILGLLAYLVGVWYNSFLHSPVLGLTFTGALENLIRPFKEGRFISNTLGYLGTLMVLLVVVWNLFFNKPASSTSTE